MAQFYTEISDSHKEFIASQSMFFVATAPRVDGHVSLSPKGQDSFRVLGPNRVAYLDLTGSGSETAAHLLDNGRITVMFCSFTRNPLILRLYGEGRSIQPGEPEWTELYRHFPQLSGARQIITINVESVQTSCGYAVPLYELVAERDTLQRWSESKTPAELDAYRQKKNVTSIDGLPTGLKPRVEAH